ncbi:MAG: ankyrin repeat domain-containing F-box protein, partial [Candidatus Babeliales bacterium]
MKKTLYLFLTIFLGNTVNAMEQSNSPLMKLPNEMLIKILSFTDFIDKEKFNDPKNVTDLDESVKLKNLKLVCKNFNTAGTALINISLKNLESYNSDNQFSNVNQELSLKKNYLLKKRNLIFPEIKEILIEVFPFVNELAFMDDDSKSVKESGDQIIRLFLDNSSYYCGLNKTNMEKIWGPLCENNLFTNLNNIKNRKHGQTPLHLASLYDYPEVVKLLLENGAKVDIQDYCGDTPLHGASFSGHTEVVKLLLENGAPIDIQDNFGDTPLYSASVRNHPKVVKLLLENGAPIDIQDN